jgi:hypothetical protein
MQVAEIRHKNIDTMHTLIREAHPHVNDHSAILCLQYGDISADLSQSAQWREAHSASGVDIDLFPGIEPRLLNFSVLEDRLLHLIADIGRLVSSALATTTLALAAFPATSVLTALLFVVTGTSVLTAVLLSVLASLSLLTIALLLLA